MNKNEAKNPHLRKLLISDFLPTVVSAVLFLLVGGSEYALSEKLYTEVFDFQEYAPYLRAGMAAIVATLSFVCAKLLAKKIYD